MESSRLCLRFDTSQYASRTALHWAVKRKHRRCVEVLLQHFADTTLKDSNGLTPRDYTDSSAEILALLGVAAADSSADDGAGDDANDDKYVPNYLRHPEFPYTSTETPAQRVARLKLEEDTRNAAATGTGTGPSATSSTVASSTTATTTATNGIHSHTQLSARVPPVVATTSQHDNELAEPHTNAQPLLPSTTTQQHGKQHTHHHRHVDSPAISHLQSTYTFAQRRSARRIFLRSRHNLSGTLAVPVFEEDTMEQLIQRIRIYTGHTAISGLRLSLHPPPCPVPVILDPCLLRDNDYVDIIIQ